MPGLTLAKLRFNVSTLQRFNDRSPARWLESPPRSTIQDEFSRCEVVWGMSGHSKWHNIRLKKEKVDQVRGKLFSKLAREIAVAAKEGGGDPDGNPRLRTAIDHAREAGMPNDNIQRAIQRGAGGAEGATFETITYEGYAPGGVAVLVEVLTDNRNRAASDVRNLFTR